MERCGSWFRRGFACSEFAHHTFGSCRVQEQPPISQCTPYEILNPTTDSRTCCLIYNISLKKRAVHNVVKLTAPAQVPERKSTFFSVEMHARQPYTMYALKGIGQKNCLIQLKRERSYRLLCVPFRCKKEGEIGYTKAIV